MTVSLRENQMKKKMMRKSSSSKSSPSFMSLPFEVVLKSLARISRTNYPILSLVSKSFRSLLASPDLEAARSLIGKPEKYLYVCLNLNPNPNPSWFILPLTPNQEKKLIPIPSFPYKHLNSSNVVSVGQETYIIGGVEERSKRRSRRVFVIDSKSHQWRELPKMRVCRKDAAVKVIDGKIYVIGGCTNLYINTENYGEVYDPMTQTWEPTTLAVTTNPINVDLSMTCFLEVEIETGKTISARARIRNGKLFWGGSFRIESVLGVEALSSNHLIAVANSDGGRRVTVWWKAYAKESQTTEIWCAEILIEFCQVENKCQGFIEWSENVLTFQGCHESDDDSLFLLHSSLITHDH